MYIGDTDRSLKTRITEHQTAIRNWDRNNAIACHVTGLNTTSSVKGVKCWLGSLTENEGEGIMIKTTKDTMNTDPGVSLNPWTAINST